MYKVLFDFASQKTIEYMLFEKKKKKKETREYGHKQEDRI